MLTTIQGYIETLEQSPPSGLGRASARQDVERPWSELPRSVFNALASVRDLVSLDLAVADHNSAFRPGEDLTKLEIYPEDENGLVALDDVPVEKTWAAMVDVMKKGKVKSIGVSSKRHEQEAMPRV